MTTTNDIISVGDEKQKKKTQPKSTHCDQVVDSSNFKNSMRRVVYNMASVEDSFLDPVDDVTLCV